MVERAIHDPDTAPAVEGGLLEQFVEQLSAHLEERLHHATRVVGSYLRTYLRAAWRAIRSASWLAFQAWFAFLMPYLAYASLGIYAIGHGLIWFGIPMITGVVLVFGPPVVLGLSIHKRFAGAQSTQTAEESNVVKLFGRRARFNAAALIVPATETGRRFWLIYVVGGAALITIATEVLWAIGVPWAADIHDSFIAWPNVRLLDEIVGLVRAVLPG